MKAHGSVFLLMLRHTWWKTLLVLAVMAGAEAGSFLVSLPADLTGMALTAEEKRISAHTAGNRRG